MVLPPRSGPDQPGDRLGRLADLRVRHLAPLGGRLGNAMTEMVLHQAKRHRLQRPGRRRHLGQDVDAVLVFLDHLLQATDLALDAAQPQEVSLLVRGVSVHADLPRYRLSNYYTPAGYSSGRQAAPVGIFSDYCDPRAATSRPCLAPGLLRTIGCESQPMTQLM